MKKQTILAVMALIITASLALFAGAISLDTAETAVLAADTTVYVDANSVYTIPEGTVVTDIDLGNTKAVYNETAGTITGKGYAGTVVVTTEDGDITVNFRGATKWLPGLNILTGTTSSYDGETADSAALTFTMDKTGNVRGVFEVVADSSNAANSVIKLTKSSGQNSMTLYTKNSFETISNKRPVQIVISHINPGFDTYCLINGTTNIQYKQLGLAKNTNAAWETKSIGKGTGLKTDKDMTSIGFQFGPQDSSVTAPVYIDNLAFIPYYEITYSKNDGSYETDYVLYDFKANLLTSYTVNNSISDAMEGKKFIGWSTTFGATVPMTTVPLNYSDVTLYPVFSDSTLISTDTLYTTIDGSATVTALGNIADIDWEFIPGKTGATFNEATLTVKGAGYPGTVTVKATANGVTESVNVVLTGVKNWKPGLNILTTSTDAFSLSTDSAVAEEQFNLLFAHDDRAVAVAETNPLNPMAGYVVKLSAANGKTFPHLYFKTEFATAIEKERPVDFSYSYYGDVNTWVNANGRNANDIFRKAAGGAELILPASASDWTNGNLVLTSTTRKNNNDTKFFSFVGCMSKASNYGYIDNLSYIPYYKVTYIGLDGETVAATEYVLKDAKGNFLKEYTLTRPVEGATSYYLDKELTMKVENDKVALDNKDIVIYASSRNEVGYSVNGTVFTKEYTSENITIAKPSETDASLSDTNFVVWVDADGKKYYASETVAAADLAGKTLTAYLQDATKPAVSYAYNGNYNPAYEKAGYRYTELIEDEGRDVLHIHLWNGLDGKGVTFPTDWRASFRLNNANNTYTHYDPTEYNLVQYITKIPAAYQNSNGKPVATNAVNLRLYAQTTTGGVFTNPVIENRISNVPVKDEYVAYLFDYSANDKFLANGGYGFCLDYIHNATYGGDAYIDSLVVYRKGIFTVNYNTNAPAGATVIKNVAADTNRGVGTGYILKDIRPEVNGYVFKGWATTPDATAADVVTTIDLKGDTTVYAVWEADTNYKTVVNEDKTEIKSFGENVNGIRFHTSTSNAVKNTVNELGFLVTRVSFLTDFNDYTELKHDFKADDATLKYSIGVAYKKNKTDIIYGEGNDGEIIYTAMVKGIPTSAKTEKLVVRPYAKYLVNGKEVTVYGEAMSASLVDVAEAVRNENGEAYTNNAEYIESILG